MCLILFIIFSFFDWQQVSVGPYTAGKNLWHGIGIITVLIAIAYLIWEIGRALDYNGGSGPGDARHDVGRVRGRAARLHRHHVPRLERLPPLAGSGSVSSSSIIIAVVAFKRAKDEGVEMPKMPQGVSVSRGGERRSRDAAAAPPRRRADAAGPTARAEAQACTVRALAGE